MLHIRKVQVLFYRFQPLRVRIFFKNVVTTYDKMIMFLTVKSIKEQQKRFPYRFVSFDTFKY